MNVLTQDDITLVGGGNALDTTTGSFVPSASSGFSASCFANSLAMGFGVLPSYIGCGGLSSKTP
jgi:hypothetical protein